MSKEDLEKIREIKNIKDKLESAYLNSNKSEDIEIKNKLNELENIVNVVIVRIEKEFYGDR